jgi:hypothetical protein
MNMMQYESGIPRNQWVAKWLKKKPMGFSEH